MTLTELIRQDIGEFHLLKHPFYQAWMAGTLKKETLQNYAKDYFTHVNAFPRYVSATHSLCEDLQNRQVLLENLIDEERGAQNHPELWLQFAEGLGVKRSEVLAHQSAPGQNLVNNFMGHCRSSYAEGLAALYAYEYQIPAIAETKVDGLKANYGICDQPTLAFFEVHKQADVYHSQACEKQLDQLQGADRDNARAAARKTAKALWDFLSQTYGEMAHAC